MDHLFKVEIITSTPNPQQVIYAALHQDYSPDFVWESRDKWPNEQKCGEIVVQRLLAGDRGEWGPCEHPQIILACGYFPHFLVQQLTRHRLLSFDVQSLRYTGEQVIEVAQGKRDLESVFYLRPVDKYTDRQGTHYEYTKQLRDIDFDRCYRAASDYAELRFEGLSEEHARNALPYCLRQHFVMSCNIRSICHLLDLRLKKNSQLEAQWFAQLLLERFEEWTPAIADWYKQNRAHKGRLAP